MAISECHYRILKGLRDDGTLPECKSILNICQPEWYGDMDWRTVIESDRELSPLEVACAVYDSILGPASHVSIDMSGDSLAYKLDLNCTIDLGAFRDYDVVVNHGTAEHIFNIAQVFRTMHDHCNPGGFMVHESPFTGWIDHGFYNINPTLFYDLAAANGYDLPFIAIVQITEKRILPLSNREQLAHIVRCGGPPNNSMLFVLFKKKADEPFKIPMQGIYAGNVSEAVERAWKELR